MWHSGDQPILHRNTMSVPMHRKHMRPVAQRQPLGSSSDIQYGAGSRLKRLNCPASIVLPGYLSPRSPGHLILMDIQPALMGAENCIITNMLATSGIDDEHKKDILATYDRVRRLFVNASTNRNLDDFLLTRDALNYSRAFGLSNTAAIYSAGANFQGNNLWANIYNKTIQNAGLTDEERSFLYCLRYMLLVESRTARSLTRCATCWHGRPIRRAWYAVMAGIAANTLIPLT